MRQVRKAPRGFTLIEILIVVIILGILAAIVIPQFSNASTSAKTSSVSSTAQTLRSQVALYRLQHNDTLPPAANFWPLMTSASTPDGTIVANGTPNSYGPYMQQVPLNALNGASTVFDAAVIPVQGGTAQVGTACGWEYDYAAGTGSGRVFGTGTDFLTVLP